MYCMILKQTNRRICLAYFYPNIFIFIQLFENLPFMIFQGSCKFLGLQQQQDQYKDQIFKRNTCIRQKILCPCFLNYQQLYIYIRLKIKPKCQNSILELSNFVLPSTGFEPTPLIHCSTIRLALRPAPQTTRPHPLPIYIHYIHTYTLTHSLKRQRTEKKQTRNRKYTKQFKWQDQCRNKKIYCNEPQGSNKTYMYM